MSLNLIYNRVSDWNGKRYDRVHDLNLTKVLLVEEYTEFLDSDEAVHQLDALCDVTYVALGALWKLELSNEIMNEDAQTAVELVYNIVDSNVLMPVYFIPAFIDAMAHDAEFPVSLALQCIINLSFVQMQSMGLTLEQCYEALDIVCDSNDSKSIKKTDPGVKANDGDKGPYFVAPEAKLQGVLDERHN